MPQDHLRELEQHLSLPPAWDSQRFSSPTLADSEVGQHRGTGDEVSGGHYVDSCTVLDMYDWKPLPPRPLDPNRGSHRTSGDNQVWRTNPTEPKLGSPSGSQAHRRIISCFRNLVETNVDEDQDPKNKPLPLEPFYHPDTQHQGPFGPTNNDRGTDEAQIICPSDTDACALIPQHLTLGYPISQVQMPVCSPRPLNSTVAGQALQLPGNGDRLGLLAHPEKDEIDHQRIFGLSIEPPEKVRGVENAQWRWRSRRLQKGKCNLLHAPNGHNIRKQVNRGRAYRPRLATAKPESTTNSLRPSPRLCRQPGTLGMEEPSEHKLLSTFFGFDLMGQPHHPLNDARLHRVRHYLASQPHPDTMINGERYPIVSCAWLRNFIVTSPYKLNIDRGRLRGLRLEDNSSHNIHRGFGLLWDFLEACGSKARYPAHVVGNCDEMSKEDQLGWFQVSIS